MEWPNVGERWMGGTGSETGIDWGGWKRDAGREGIRRVGGKGAWGWGVRGGKWDLERRRRGWWCRRRRKKGADVE